MFITIHLQKVDVVTDVPVIMQFFRIKITFIRPFNRCNVKMNQTGCLE